MKEIIILSIGLLFFINCDHTASKTNQNNDSIDTIKRVENIIKIDTNDTREFADKLLKDLDRPSDNQQTFACMDSLVSNKIKTRDFYWQVFQVILTKSDGALSEVVGVYLIAYLEKYPLEFTQRYKKLDKKLQSKCVHYTASELYFDESNIALTTILYSCKNCKNAEKTALEKFIDEVRTEITNLIQNDLESKTNTRSTPSNRR